MKQVMKTYYRSAVALLSMMAVLSFGACADDDIVNERKDVKDGLGFSVSDIQDATEDQTRAIATHPEDYAVRQLDFAEAAGNACLQETTVPGVNPVKRDAATRSDFQNSIGAPFGAFACKNGSGKPDFFYNEKVNANGNMVSPKAWTSNEASLQFYAVYPFVESSNPNVKLTQTVAGELPCIDFTTPTDIANQIDLMTASTQNINHTNTGGGEHVVPLTFYHSLTAIRFGVGSNLSWGKTIKSVEFQGVYSKGRYDIKTKTWSNQSTAQNYKLDNIGVSTSEAVNNVILKDGNTFLMVPQTLPAGAKIVVTFSDNTSVTAKIEGKKWKPGTTKTYMITEKNSNWEYIIEASEPTAAAYNGTQTGYYGITSYRKVGAHMENMKWKVVGYDANNDGTFSMAEKPEWVNGLTLNQGDGSTYAEQGRANVQQAALQDFLAPLQAKLKENPKGTATNYYDLSTHDIKGNAIPRQTANCYIISHPGFYKLPLVYGNAIKGTAGEPNKTNEDSYKTTETGGWLYSPLQNFKDHAGQNITDPWIEKTNGGANNGIDGAKLVWADVPNLVHFNPANTITRTGNETYLQFEVKESDIKQGNAVVAVTKGGTVVWSWHLWFTTDNVLDKTKVTNYDNKDYYLAAELTGWKYSVWGKTLYQQPRKVKVRVEQLGGIKKPAEFTITQNPGDERRGYATIYQWGRKDALPGTDTDLTPQSTYTFDNTAGGRSLEYAIQHPGTMFTMVGGSGTNTLNWCSTQYDNLWAMNYISNANIKTVYDPCPAGFRVSTTAAFTAFTKTSSGYTFYPADFNVAGPWNNGWYFYNRLTSPDATIFCPSVNMRSPTDGKLDGRAFSCWSITPGYGTYAREDVFYSSTNGGSACAYAVFPMADE